VTMFTVPRGGGAAVAGDGAGASRGEGAADVAAGVREGGP
jgi:hypothetical protein